MKPKLNCLRIRTRQALAQWAVATFGFEPSWSELRFVADPEYFDAHVTSRIYHLVGHSGDCRTIELSHRWAASRTVRAVLRAWQREFGAGLPRDYGVAINFER